jgi:choline dehydrogenase
MRAFGLTGPPSVSAVFDYVIVGSGSAGSALAHRLSEDGRRSVLVLEYGGTDLGPLIQMPAALSYPMNMSIYDWGYVSEPELHLGGRQLVAPRGKVIGGSSSINGMVYVRGHARDYDTWEIMGARNWGFRHVLPYFKRMETAHEGEEGWRGTNGPVHVSRGPRINPLYKAFIEAGREAGYPVTSDYNGRQQEGFGEMEMTVRRGTRWSAARAYLRPALKRRNVALRSRALARRIILEGRRAVGVEYSRFGQVRTARAAREVIISASAFNSPKLLELSGIGDGARLKAAGIKPVHQLAGVGENLQDHLEIYFQVRCPEAITLNSKLGFMWKGLIGAQWLFLRSGLGATNHFESCAFIRSKAGVEYPDIQYHFLPGAIRYDGKAAAPGHGFQVHVGPMRSASRGHVHVRSADPAQAPVIRFNYMSEPQDWLDFRTCVHLTREIFRQNALARYVGSEIQPGDHVVSDEAIDAFVAEHCESAFHPSGTCRMGDTRDPLAVVDSNCRVIGMENLRVVDSSIFPRITNGNLNAPSMMVGERAADLILGRDPLPPSNLEPWINPRWETSQR